MAKQSEETKLKRRKPENRRGVFTTWGTSTWQALLAKSERNIIDALADCTEVGSVERDITQAVLEGLWRQPPGEWLLVIRVDTQEWATLVSRTWSSDAFEKLAPQFEGQMLLTGHSGEAGTVFARVVERDEKATDGVAIRFDFQSDGEPWDSDDDDEFGDGEELDDDELDEAEFEDDEEEDEFEQALNKLTETRLVADDLPPDWLEQFDSLPDAHQAVFRHLDAYVPGLYYLEEDAQLTAPFGHDDILPHITSIDLVRLGKVSADEPSPDALAETRKFHAAIRSADVADVQKAIASGAILSPVDGDISALYAACYNLAYKPYEPRCEIINLLLDAGADPNNNRSHEGTEYADTPLARIIGRRPPLEITDPIVRRLVECGADLNPPSPYPLQLGERPLHHAAKKALPDWVTLLLELGADPLMPSEAGRTPRQSVEDLIAAKAESEDYTAETVEQERKDYAPILNMLEEAEQKS